MTSVQQTPPVGESGWTAWGHDHAVHELQAAARRGPRHAYILSGFDHVGKSALAEAFAQSLVCTQPPSPGIACRVCSACRRVGRGTHPDVSRYDLERQQSTAEKASTSKNLSLNIQTVRGITSSISLRPTEARYRIVIVDDVETMQEVAQEAFLKTLEEPPAYAVILLLTTDVELLLETIRSRAMTVHLQTVPATVISSMLEATGIGSAEAVTIAGSSMGRPGWAMRAAKDEALLTSRLEINSSVLSWIKGDRYERLVEAIRLADAFAKDRVDVYARLLAAQVIWRTGTLQSLGLADDAPLVAGQPGIQVDDPAGGLTALKSIDLALSDLDANVRPRLALQTMVLQWPTV